MALRMFRSVLRMDVKSLIASKPRAAISLSNPPVTPLRFLLGEGESSAPIDEMVETTRAPMPLVACTVSVSALPLRLTIKSHAGSPGSGHVLKNTGVQPSSGCAPGAVWARAAAQMASIVIARPTGKPRPVHRGARRTSMEEHSCFRPFRGEQAKLGESVTPRASC
jgi:hypothetical protein